MTSSLSIQSNIPENDINHVKWDNADLIITYLRILKVDYIFGVPGGAIEPFYDAISRNQSSGGPKIIVSRHESGAAFMAYGYTRETGKLGVCCATTGPGTTNLLTGVASAYADNIPMLVITAQTPLPKFGKNALQESSCTAIDTVGIFRYCTNYNTLISHSEQMNSKLVAAILAAFRIPAGPSHISIPADILRNKVDTPPLLTSNILLNKTTLTDDNAILKLIDILCTSKHIALFLGRDCGDAINLIIEFAELTNAAITAGPAAKRWVDSFHPQYYGVFGFAGHESANNALLSKEVDIIIAIGTQISELGTNGWNSKLLSEKLIHIDEDSEHFSRTPMAKLHVCGNLGSTLKKINRIIKQKTSGLGPWSYPLISKPHLLEQGAICGPQVQLNLPESCYSNEVPLKPQRVVTEFAKYIPEEYRLHLDAGNIWAWFTHYHHSRNLLGHYHIAMGFGSMGWAIGAAVGNCIGSGKPSVCITGDGSYLMAGQEITVALQHQLPVIYVVFNDSGLGMVKHGQKLGGAEEIGFDLPTVNFAKMAEAMGVEGIQVKTINELITIDWHRLGCKQAPTMIDLYIDPNETPPMAQRVKGLATQSATPGG
ncbi:thiamine pyrophosphate-binding protein [Cognaticolwellia mytili]|uniref:thiamine pyrophosphate-binding protein n=1 Tax=Cognaticolwellia mytili TaxID=1888913 RepID=UPI001B808090|nr:thiamine pyrophosphate-binding protein [Cognaticolwellia mytili]